tara:strand:- start:166 stop:603 length:438 start_codon:yes stop_codon:yes gene_type:complete
MSDNDNYWSDEDESEELIQDSRELPPIEIDSEEEEEFQDILRMVSNKLKSKEESTFTLTEIETKKNSKKKKSKNKNNNKKIIFDMNSEDSNEKKGWRSKRMREKKGPEVIKRKFKPRLPPPGNKFKNLKKNKEVNINLDSDFPSL